MDGPMGHGAGSQEEEPHQKGGKESHGVRKLESSSPGFAIDQSYLPAGSGFHGGFPLCRQIRWV